MIYKLFWAFRALYYAPFFQSIGFPSYFGKPIYTRGLRNVVIGQYVRIFPGLRLEAFDGGRITIGNDVGIAQNVHITSAQDELIISKGTVILGNSFITNIDHEYFDINTAVLKQNISVKRTFIGENCFIGFGAAIQAGSVLGRHCIVGAHSVVRGEFPDYCVIVGSPARIIKRWDEHLNAWKSISNQERN
jgi:acetyltransferase-like isoleucine patch superfamily enzyme